MSERRRDVLRRAVQDSAAEEGVEITEAEEHAAMELLDGLIPQNAEVFDTWDDLRRALEGGD